VRTELEVSGRGLKKAMSRMNDLGVKFTVITGELELQRGSIVVRNMASGDQEEIPLESLKSKIIGAL